MLDGWRGGGVEIGLEGWGLEGLGCLEGLEVKVGGWRCGWRGWLEVWRLGVV